MAKAKTSKMLKKSSEITPSNYALDLKLKANAKLTRHQTGKRLSDRAFVIEALTQCLTDGDEGAFKEILKGHYEAVNTAKALRKAELSARTYYEAVSDKGNPRLRTVMKLVRGINF